MNFKCFNLLPYYHLEFTSENICLYDLKEKSMISIEAGLRNAAKSIIQKRMIDIDNLSKSEKNFFNELITNKMGYWKSSKWSDLTFYSSFVDTKYPTISKQIRVENCEILVSFEKMMSQLLLEETLKSLENLQCRNIKITFTTKDIDKISLYLNQISLLQKKFNFKISIQLPFFEGFSKFKEKFPNFAFLVVVQSEREAEGAKKLVNKNSIFFDLTSDRQKMTLLAFIKRNKVSSNNLIVQNECNSETTKLIADYISEDNSYLFGLDADEMAYNENFNIHQLGHVIILSGGEVILDDGKAIGNLKTQTLIEILSSEYYLLNLYKGKKNQISCQKCSYRLGCLLKKENIIYLQNMKVKATTLCGKR